jgi:glucosyl-3-phosphoglycerate phosphatase
VRAIIWRHGRTSWNAAGRYQGQADPPLDETGVAQAALAATMIATLRPDVVVTSDLQRAAGTAEALARVTGLVPLIDSRLRERSLGHWEGLTRAEVAQRYPDEMADWLAGRDVRRRGGESRTEVAARAMAAFAEIDEVALAVVVTHSATAIALTSALLGLPQDAPVVGPLANCHWTEMRRDDAGWRVRAHNIGAPGLVIPLPAPDPDTVESVGVDAEA